MSEEAHLDAVVALLTAVGAEPRTPQQLHDAAALPPFYNEVHVTQRLSDGPRRAGAPSQVTQWRILTRAVGRRYGNAQEMRRLAAVALHEGRLTVAGEAYHVERAVADDPIAPDDGWWSGTSEFTY